MGGPESHMRANPATANALATKMYEEKLIQRDSSEDSAMKQRFGDSMSPLMDPNHASMMKSGAISGQGPGRAFHGVPGGMGGNLQQFQNRNPQIPLSASDIKSEMNPMMNPRAGGSEGSLMGVAGSTQAGNNLTLKGWPLTGLDSLRLQQQKSMMQSSQPFHQFQMQQQLLLQAQQNLASPSAMDMETRKLRMLMGNRNMALGKDGQLNTMGEGVPNVGSTVQVGCPVLPRSDSEMLMKQQLQNSQLSPQNAQSSLSGQQPQISNQHHQQDKMVGAGSMSMDGSMSNSFRGNEQASKGQVGRKRKQPVSSSGPANSTGTANTTGPSPGSQPSTPSTHTPGDVMSMPNMPHNGVSSKPSMSMFGSDTLSSAPNQMGDMGRFVDDATLEDNVESFLSQEEGDPRDTLGRGMDVGKGSFKEVAVIQASSDKVNCCHFSSDGKLLASGGRDKKAVVWHTDTQKPKCTLEEHTHPITDVRFSPSMARLATSSYDRSVRVWDPDNQGYSIRNFTGHSAAVMSLDFHPSKEDIICSCDDNGEIRYWSITNGSCTNVFEGGMTQVRFQPRHGKYLAAAAEGLISLFDVDAHTRIQTFQGHTQKVQSLCWDPTGDYLASVSEDVVRIWSVSSNNNKWLHELSCNGSKVHSCAFHPFFPHLLVIGGYQNFELWNFAENKRVTIPGHDGLIASLAASPATGMVASASHDNCVKLWK